MNHGSPKSHQVRQEAAGHTPGPWHVFSVYAQHEVRTPSDTLVAVVQSREHARLIAAAPELLAVLREAFKAFSHDDDGPVWADSTIAKARAAIAKATGNQP